VPLSETRVTRRPGAGRRRPRMTARTIEQEILRRVQQRVWPPGSLIPNETDLAAELGCARTTINGVLQDLAARGLLERRRRAGTRVAEHPLRKATVEIPVVRREIEAQGKAYGFEILERAVAPLPPGLVADREGGEALHLLGRHLADGRAYQLEDRWIDLAFVPAARDEAFERYSPNEWLVREVPFTSGTLTLTTVRLEAAEAALLEVPAGEAALAMRRTTWLGPSFLTTARLLHPPGYTMLTSF